MHSHTVGSSFVRWCRECEPAAAMAREAPYLRGLAVLAVLTALALCGTPAAASAQSRDTPELSFDAFGTLGLVYSTEDRADYAWNTLRPDGPGHSRAISPDVDSRLAGQLTAFIIPKLTAVAQVVAEQRADDTYAPRLEWANIRYSFTPDFSVRAGRTALPIFMVSDSRKVSYANPWVRPPAELYGLVPVFTLDGVDATYRMRLGSWNGTLNAGFGRTEADFSAEGEEDISTAESEKTLNANVSLQRGGFTGRISFGRGVLGLDTFDALFDAFRQFGPEGEAIADRLEVDGTPWRFGGVGFEYDAGSWFAMSEIGWLDFNSVLGEKVAGYGGGGYGFGSLTPYVTYSRVEVLNETSVPGLSLSGLSRDAAEQAAGLNAALNTILQGAPVQQSLSLGGRWDFARGMALKLQVDFVDMLEGSPGTFINPQPEFEPGGSARVVSLATVFVF